MKLTKSPFDSLVVLGPTATGKTRLAAVMAAELGGEVISADSRQVYRHMDLGTGKDYDDYMVGGARVPGHLIDIVEAGYRYNLFEFQEDFAAVFSEVRGRGMLPVICGGSGLYLEAVLRGYRLSKVPVNEALREELEPKSMQELTDLLASLRALHNTTDILSRKRLVRAIEIAKYEAGHPQAGGMIPPLNPLVVGIVVDRDTRRRNISGRLRRRLAAGMVDEVKRLMEQGLDKDTLLYYGLEYKYIALFLAGELSFAEMQEQLETAIHRFAKRQMTWFRGMERRGIVIRWLEYHLTEQEKVSAIREWWEAGK